MTPKEIKVRENMLRYKAARCGMRLDKCPRRDPDALAYGLWALIEVSTNRLINKPLSGQPYSMTLDQVASHFAEGKKATAKRGKR